MNLAASLGRARDHLKVLPGAYVCRETEGVNPADRYIRVALVHDEKTTREAMTRLATVL